MKLYLKTTDELRPVLAAYFNMARHNMYTTLKFISDKAGIRDNIEAIESMMHKMNIINKEYKLRPEEEILVRSLIFKHFPFMKFQDKVTDEENLYISTADLRYILSYVATVLTYFRDKYSHTIFNDWRDNKEEYRKNEERIGYMMLKMCTISTRLISNRFKANKNTVQEGMLNDDSLKFITNGRNSITMDHDTRQKKVSPCPDHFLYPFTSNDKPKRISLIGQLQFICLFLHKKYITELLSKTGVLDSVSDKSIPPLLSERRLLLEVFSALRIVLPESKLSSERTDLQVAMDMLNEIKKCPEEMYELLCDRDRARFNVQSSNGENVLLRRHGDRFPQLVLSYLDMTKAFDYLRFQVNAGKFRYLLKENKKCIDGEERLRVLQKDLNGFARIQEMEEKRMEKVENKNSTLWNGYRILKFEDSPRNDADILPYITDSHTKYIFDGENINISIGEFKSLEGNIIFTRNGDFIPSISRNEETNRFSVNCRQAECKVSRYELVGLLFYHLLYLKSKGILKSVETIIAETVLNYRKFFSDIRDGEITPISSQQEKGCLDNLLSIYGLSKSDIPQKIQDYLLGRDERNRFAKYKKQFISQMLEKTRRQIKRIEDDIKQAKSTDNKPGKRNFVRILPGRMASFLASDIVMFQTESPEKKLTGLNFAILQSILALFSDHGEVQREKVIQTLLKSGLIESNGNAGSHPFLHLVFTDDMVSNTVTLYHRYLKEKIHYLEGNIDDAAQFLHQSRQKWTDRNTHYYQALAERYLSSPILLPRQLFEVPILNHLLSLGNKKLNEALQSAVAKGKCNISFMIMQYLDCVMGNEPQIYYGFYEDDMEHKYNFPFYAIVRKYPDVAQKVLNSLKNDKEPHSVYIRELTNAIRWAASNPFQKACKRDVTPRPKDEDIKASLKRSFLRMTELEKIFRRYAVQDALMFLSALKVIEHCIAGDERNIARLQDITPDGGSILESIVPKLNVEININSRNGRQKGKRTLILNNIKIKNIGDVYKLLHDNRISSLLISTDADNVPVDSIRNELQDYDDKRVSAFENILCYEGQHGPTNGKHLTQRIDFNYYLNNDKQTSRLDKETLKIIRNAFCHNSYPESRIVEKGKEKKILYGNEISGNAKSMVKNVEDIVKNNNRAHCVNRQ